MSDELDATDIAAQGGYQYGYDSGYEYNDGDASEVNASKSKNILVAIGDGATTVTKKVVTRAQEIIARFFDLLVAAFAVAAGLAWKDTVFWMFSAKGPLGFLKYSDVTLAIAITTVGATLTALRAYLPMLPKSEASRNGNSVH